MCCYELWDGIISSSFTNGATVSPWLKEGIKEALKLPHGVFQPSLVVVPEVSSCQKGVFPSCYQVLALAGLTVGVLS